MVSLGKQSGLPITFDPETLTLTFPDVVETGEVSERTFAEMKKFIREETAQPTRESVYSVWRRVARKSDAPRMKQARLRYDLTLIPPGKFVGSMGEEFFRTAGHYHTKKPGHALPLPEVYEVLYGRAYWIIQRPDPRDPARLEEIYAIEAGPGEKAIMLPGFGHVSVNAFDGPLLMANWIDDTFEYDYGPYERFRGAGYWMVEGLMPDTIEFEKNTHYGAVPELKKLRPKELPEFGLLSSKPAYTPVEDLAKLRFLSAPEEFTHTLTLDHCYRPIVQ